MTAKDLIRQTIEFCHFVTRAYVEDLTDAELLVRSVPGANHIAWQLGHLITSMHQMLGALNQAPPALPEGFESAHAKATSTSNDPALFATKARYLELLDQMKAASLAAVDATADSHLDDPSPEPMREYAPTIANILMLLGTHLLMHAGQFVPIRRKLGKPPLM